ncbi:MAG: YwaF family protein [Clostridia bacterium]|nr:YwaF family protein [Clostridia bacterium]
MFFCPPYTVEPCGLFTWGHMILLLTTAILIAVGLYVSRHMNAREVRRTVRLVTAILWGLELFKIIFVLAVTGSRNPNDYIPLYYCSLVLYAGLFSSVGRGVVQRIGDVFLSSGSIVGGICFLLCPNTSLPRYPAFHFISFHSFLLHGLMVYLGLLLLLRGVCRLSMSDLKHCAGLVSAMCLVAWIFNTVWDRLFPHMAVANLMFMSKDFPGTPVTVLYRLTGALFPLFMWLIQAFVPFLAVYGVYKIFIYVSEKKVRNNQI